MGCFVDFEKFWGFFGDVWGLLSVCAKISSQYIGEEELERDRK